MHSTTMRGREQFFYTDYGGFSGSATGSGCAAEEAIQHGSTGLPAYDFFLHSTGIILA
jgi:hypothetical protein